MHTRFRATSAVFAVLVAVFAVLFIILPKSSFSEAENRMLADIPRVTATKLISGELSQSFEEYMSDHFPFRDRWIRVKTMCEILCKSEIKNVYIGADGYLIEKHDIGKSDAQRRKNTAFLRDFAVMAEKTLGNGSVKIALVPPAEYVLKEKLPLLAVPADYDMVLSEVSAELPANTFADLRAALSARADEYIFYRNDHHWTTLGSYYALCELLGKEPSFERVTLSRDFYGTVSSKLGYSRLPDTIELFSDRSASFSLTIEDSGSERTESSLIDCTALTGRDKYSAFLYGNTALSRITGGEGGRLLVIKDSYANCMLPMLASFYGEITVLDLRYFSGSVRDIISSGQVDEVLVLYGVVPFSEDTSLYKLSR